MMWQSGPHQKIQDMRKALTSIGTAYQASDHHGAILSTTSFNEVMFASGGNDVAWEVVKRLNSRISWLQSMTIASPGRATSEFGQMKKIFRAVEQHQPEAAASASRDQVNMAANVARTLLREQLSVKL